MSERVCAARRRCSLAQILWSHTRVRFRVNRAVLLSGKGWIGAWGTGGARRIFPRSRAGGKGGGLAASYIFQKGRVCVCASTGPNTLADTFCTRRHRIIVVGVVVVLRPSSSYVLRPANVYFMNSIFSMMVICGALLHRVVSMSFVKASSPYVCVCVCMHIMCVCCFFLDSIVCSAIL